MRIGMMTDVYKPHTSGITNYISLRYTQQARRFFSLRYHLCLVDDSWWTYPG
jgi:hypothetical protein